jgi:hypothetical protein
MDVIITSDLYQTPSVRNKWVFPRRFDSTIDALGIDFWLYHIDCFELFQVVH